MIQVHLKRGVITADQPFKVNKYGKKEAVTNSIIWMMKKTSAKHPDAAKDYTEAIIDTMNHPFLMFIDHYYVGPTVTDKAKKFAANSVEHRKLRYTPNKVEIRHYGMDYDTFLSEKNIFDIANRVDPNTFSGSMHNLLNAMTFDKNYQWQVKNYYRENPDKKIPLTLQMALNL